MWLAAADQVSSEMQFGGWNTDALFEADADPLRLRELATLWESSPHEAFSQFLALAEAGSVWSMIRVGCGYCLGLGVKRDRASAERWFDAAFGRGSDYGLIWSARIARSRGDVAKAVGVLKVGVERGLPDAMVDLANLEMRKARTQEDRNRARRLYDTAIEKGHLPARAALARAMARGAFGWRSIPEGIRGLRASCKAYRDAIDARKDRLLAAAEEEWAKPVRNSDSAGSAHEAA